MRPQKTISSFELQQLVHQAQHLTQEQATRFFKTGPGQYAMHDRFIGVGMPMLRQIARAYTCELSEVSSLFLSPFNEIRALALLILIEKFQNPSLQQDVYEVYLRHKAFINNWNLVDISASQIIGAYLWQKDCHLLYEILAPSGNMWERRIAIVSTHFFIKKNSLEHTFALTEKLLSDPEDLMHKACGWMLREAGKKDKSALIYFLKKYTSVMPRTMWRYATEKLSLHEKHSLN